MRVCGLILIVGLRMDTEHSAITEPVRRIEVFTGAGRRRRWSGADKARIVAEIATSGASVCAVARRHGLSPQQLFGWRRQLRDVDTEASETDELRFVPAVVDAAASAAPAICPQQNTSRPTDEASAGSIIAVCGAACDAAAPAPGSIAASWTGGSTGALDDVAPGAGAMICELASCGKVLCASLGALL